MCWSTYNKELIVPKIAEDNIVCNKLIGIDSNNIIKSKYFGFIYSLNTIYKLNQHLIVDEYLDRKNKLFYEIRKGFHSYSTNVTYRIFDRKTSWKKIQVYYKNNILDSFFRVGCLNDIRYQISMASCIIPKGSTYFLNEVGEYVSDTIIMLSVFKINKL